MKRQKILLLAFALTFFLFLILYFAVISPITKESETVKTPPVLEDGEEIGTSDRYFMFGSIAREDIEKIIVENKYGSFAFVANDAGAFSIEGHENVNYDEKLFASLVATSTYTLAKTKVGSDLDDDELSEYGLLEPQANWIVTDKSGGYFRVYVGDRLLTGGGYYCMFEGRRSVYVLDVSIEYTVLVPVEDYVTPVLCAGLSHDDYFMVDNFTVYNGSEALLRINIQDKDKQINPEALVEYIMDYPTEYSPDSDLLMELLYRFMGLTGDSCVKLGATEEDLISAGLDAPAHSVSFDYHGVTLAMFFSEKTEDGKYYAVSNLYPDVIVECSAEDFDFLEYELIDWIEPYLFRQYITNIDKMRVETKDSDVTFSLYHGKDEEGKDTLAVGANGERLTSKDAENFRQYYKSFLAVYVRDYCTNDEYCTMSEEELREFAQNPENIYMSFTYTTLSGEETTLSFYRYSTRHSLVTLNGVGEFYVLTDLVDKISNDTVRLLNGEEILAYEKN